MMRLWGRVLYTPIDLNKSKRANNEHFRNMEYKKVKTNKEKMKQQKRKPTKLSIDKWGMINERKIITYNILGYRWLAHVKTAMFI